MRFFTFLISFLFTISISAQVLEENVRVLSKSQGEARFTLNEGEKVYSYEPKSDWYKIRKEVWINLESADEESMEISEGVDLFNKDNEVIGKTLMSFRLKELERDKGYRGKERFKVIVEGWLFKTKFADSSIPEERIEEIMTMKMRSKQQDEFKKLFAFYGFKKRVFDGFVTFVMFEENKTLDEEKDFRMIVIFRGEASVYGIITNDHTVTAPKIKFEMEDDPFRSIFFNKPTNNQKKLMEEIMYTFVAL